MASIAQVFVSHGYAALAYSARGQRHLDRQPRARRPERDLRRARDGVASSRGLPAGERHARSAPGASPTAAARSGTASPPASRTRPPRSSRPGPISTARSGRRTSRSRGSSLGFAKAVEARSPLIAANEDDAIHSTDPAAIKALVAPRSVAHRSSATIKTPIYMFQGRVDYAFDVTQADQRLHAPERPEASLRRAVRPRAVDVPRPRLRLRAVAGRRLVRPLPEGRRRTASTSRSR